MDSPSPLRPPSSPTVPAHSPCTISSRTSCMTTTSGNTLSKTAIDRRRYFAGFTAGCVSRTCTAPIDRLKVLRQAAVPEIVGKSTLKSFQIIVADGGMRALWRGNAVNVLKNGPETALRFGFYGRLKDTLFPGAKDLQPGQRLCTACMAGAGSLTLTYPMESQIRGHEYVRGLCQVFAPFVQVMKTRMALRSSRDPNSIIAFMKIIYNQGGFRSFFRGYSISMLSYVPYAGMEISLYELFKRGYMEHFHGYHPGDSMPHLSTPIAISIILCSSFIPLSIVYPANLMRTRYQATTSTQTLSILNMARSILKTDGPVGFYRGFLTSLSKTLPSVTISYLTFEAAMELMGLPTLGAK